MPVYISGTLLLILFLMMYGIHVYVKQDGTRLDRVSKLVDIAVGVATAAVGLVSIYVMITQNEKQELLIRLQQREHQPIFVYGGELFKSEGSAVYDCEEYAITNEGERPQKITAISVRSFVCVEYSEPMRDVEITTYIPVNYYVASRSTGNLKGVVRYSVGADSSHNNFRIYSFSQEANEYARQHGDLYIDINRVDAVAISYTDIYGENHVEYIVHQGGRRTDLSYELLFETAQRDFSHRVYELSELTLDILWNDCAPLKAIKSKKEG